MVRGGMIRRRFSTILLCFASCLSLVIGLVPASPVWALSATTVQLLDNALTGQNSGYDITIKTGATGAIGLGDTITVEFPDDTKVPQSMSTAQVRVNSITAQSVACNPTTRQVVVTLASGCNILGNVTFHLKFRSGANLINPTTSGTGYQVRVKTSQEDTFVDSSTYAIGSVCVKAPNGKVRAAYTGIQMATDNVTTVDGDTVLVASGIFDETVTVNKELTIMGVGATLPRVSGGVGTAITINSSNVTVTGLEIRSSATGVAVTGGTNNAVYNCNILLNTTMGLNNTSGNLVNAENNYWDSASGPRHSGNTFNVTSQGQSASDDVDYVPWLNAAGGTSFAPVEKSGSTTYYSSIGAAIAAATGGDTITCKAGKFKEALNINKRLTFIGERSTGADAWTVGTPGAATSCPQIIYDGATAQMIKIQANNVTMRGFKINSTGGASRGIEMANLADRSGQTIQYCTFEADTGDISVCVDDFVASGFTVNYCKFHGSGAANWFTVQDNGGTIANSTNNISYNSVDGMVSQLRLNAKGIKGITYSDNSFTNAANGILLQEQSEQSTGKFDDIVVERNTFAGGGTADYFFMVDNSVEDSDFQGGSFDGSQVIVRHNNFGDNTGGSSEAVSFDVPTPSANLAAKHNFWGDASGPTHTDAILGSITYGADVSANVNFQPWLIAQYTSPPTGGDIQITTDSLLPDALTVQAYSKNFTATGGTPLKTWAYYGPGNCADCSYPPGLIVSGTGTISGKPTTTKHDPGYTFGVMVKDAKQGTYKAFELPVYVYAWNFYITTQSPLPKGRICIPYSKTLQASGGTDTYTWSLYWPETYGNLPPGLSINGTTGKISGTPTTVGTYNFRAKVVSGDQAAYKDLSIKINPLSAPTLVLPADGANIAATSVTFKWNALTKAARYQLQVRKASDNSIFKNLILGNVTSSNQTGFPNDGTVYRWRVRAGNAAGCWGTWSAYRTFTNGKPATPTLVSPADGANIAATSVTFKWNASAGATKYQLRVIKTSDNSIFKNPVLGNVTSSKQTGFPNDGTVYRWRVRAGNAAGWSGWSAYRTFTNG